MNVVSFTLRTSNGICQNPLALIWSHIDIGAMRVLKWRKKTLLLIAVVVGLIYYAISMMVEDMTCSRAESLQLLHRLCEDYHKGLIAGNICPKLCDNKSITFQKCTNYKDGKKVLIARWGTETVILKSKKGHWTEYGLGETSFEGVNIREFMNMVKESIRLTLEISVEDFPKLNQQDLSMLTELWSLDFKDYTQTRELEKGGDIRKVKAAIRSLWALLQQNEYVMLKFLRNRRHIPDVAGTCGHFYAMEYLPHGETLDPEVLEVTGLKDETPWKDRLQVAVNLLEAVKSYDEEYHETLHLCDVKGENFGLSKNGVVKILDLDNTFLTSHLKKELQASPCSVHKDCNFFDCYGFCNLTTGQCTSHRTNNNLQVICKKIFSAGLSNRYMGLLRKAPIEMEEQLQTLVEMCAGANDDTRPLARYQAPVRMLDRIYNLLQKDLLSYRQSLILNGRKKL